MPGTRVVDKGAGATVGYLKTYDCRGKPLPGRKITKIVLCPIELKRRGVHNKKYVLLIGPHIEQSVPRRFLWNKEEFEFVDASDLARIAEAE